MYQGPVFNYVLRMVGDRALAEDLTQEIFIRIYQGLPGFSLRCRFTTWLFQVAKNRVLDELRARERKPQVVVTLDDLPPLEVDDPEGDAELLVLGWGSSLGTIRAGAWRIREAGGKVATAHLRHLNPFPPNTNEVVRRYPKVLVPEMNLGQLASLIRARFLVDARSFTKVQGVPIFAEELEHAIQEMLDG